MNNINDGTPDNTIDPPDRNCFDLGGDEDAAYDKQRAEECSEGLARFFTEQMPSEVVQLFDLAKACYDNDDTVAAGDLVAEAFSRLRDYDDEQGAITEIGQ